MGTLTYIKGQFSFDATSPAEISLAKSAGLIRKGQAFVTRNVERAASLGRFAHGLALAKIKHHKLRFFKVPEQVLVPKNKKAKPFQIETARFIMSRQNSYNADPAGCGKTIEAAMVINTKPGKTIVVCPPHLVYNWHTELRLWCKFMWDGETPHISIIKSDSEDQAFDSDIIIVSDAIVSTSPTKERLTAQTYRWGFIDEGHRHKTVSAQRTKAIYGDVADDSEPHPLIAQIDRVVTMSGTPMPNRHMELFPVVKATAPEIVDHMSMHEYGMEYCAGVENDWGSEYPGSTNHDELNARLFKHFMVAHDKTRVLKELGPKSRQLVFLDDVKNPQKYQESVLSKYSLDSLIEKGDAAYTLGDVAKYRKEVGLAKVKPVTKIIREYLDTFEREKFVVFGWHREVLEAYAAAFEKDRPLLIMGGVSKEEKAKAQKRFQELDKHRLIFCNFEAGGTGLTLTRANRFLCIEPSWNYTVNEQAEDRIYRITQTERVMCQYFLARCSLDEYMMKAVFRKQKDADKTLAIKKRK